MPKTKIRRRAWSKDDLKTFKALARQKMPAAKIARKFKPPLVRSVRRRCIWAYRLTRALSPKYPSICSNLNMARQNLLRNAQLVSSKMVW